MTVSPELNHFCRVIVFTRSPPEFTLSLSGYLESFEELRSQEQDKMSESQENVVSLLEHCSRVRVEPLASSFRPVASKVDSSSL